MCAVLGVTPVILFRLKDLNGNWAQDINICQLRHIQNLIKGFNSMGKQSYPDPFVIGITSINLKGRLCDDDFGSTFL